MYLIDLLTTHFDLFLEPQKSDHDDKSLGGAGKNSLLEYY